MMRKIECIRYYVKICACTVLLWGILAGCGIQDSALVIPMEDTMDNSIGDFMGESKETADHSGTNTSTGSGGQTGGGYSDSGNLNGISGERAVSQGLSSQEELQSAIYVYVCGAVVNPGVVALPEGSRADDALQAAGGFTEEAQRDYVNLAAKIEDGEKLYFPNMQEAEELIRVEEAEQNGLVNINTADIALLTTLPGIGEARAQDIISYRENHGDFQRKEDIKKVSGIKDSVYEKLCDKIVVQ